MKYFTYERKDPRRILLFIIVQPILFVIGLYVLYKFSKFNKKIEKEMYFDA